MASTFESFDSSPLGARMQSSTDPSSFGVSVDAVEPVIPAFTMTVSSVSFQVGYTWIFFGSLVSEPGSPSSARDRRGAVIVEKVGGGQSIDERTLHPSTVNAVAKSIPQDAAIQDSEIRTDKAGSGTTMNEYRLAYGIQDFDGWEVGDQAAFSVGRAYANIVVSSTTTTVTNSVKIVTPGEGSIYGVAMDIADIPTSAQIRAGTGGGTVHATSSAAITTTVPHGTQSLTFTGLTPNTIYSVWIVHEDPDGVLSGAGGSINRTLI